MPRPVAMLLLPYWRLAWAMVVGCLIWAVAAAQPIAAIPVLPTKTTMQASQGNPQPAPVAVLLEQATISHEAVVSCGSEGNSWLLLGPALLAAVTGCLLNRFIVVRLVLPVRPSAVPNVFRLRLLLAALSPNAP